MAQKIVNGISVDVNEEGYFTDPSQWTEEMVPELAKEMGIDDIGPKHMEVIKYLREQQTACVALTLRKLGKSGIVNIKELYQLFPKGPLKKSSFVAGIPKPASCI